MDCSGSGDTAAEPIQPHKERLGPPMRAIRARLQKRGRTQISRMKSETSRNTAQYTYKLAAPEFVIGQEYCFLMFSLYQRR
jgi:hypothetical protein